MTKEFVGTLAALYRFPVKSMQGQPLTKAHIYWHGIDGDRRYAFVCSNNRSGFPWLTGRQISEMVHYAPRFESPADVKNSAVTVTTPSGQTMAITDDALREELAAAYGDDVHLIKIGRGAFDSQVLSLMSLATLDALSEASGVAPDRLRFRQNVYLDTKDPTPFIEERWQNRQLQIGVGDSAVRIRVNRRIPRCVMINIDPISAERNANVLKTVAQTRDSCAGVHTTPEVVGHVQVGDPVYLLEA